MVSFKGQDLGFLAEHRPRFCHLQLAVLLYVLLKWASKTNSERHTIWKKARIIRLCLLFHCSLFLFWFSCNYWNQFWWWIQSVGDLSLAPLTANFDARCMHYFLLQLQLCRLLELKSLFNCIWQHNPAFTETWLNKILPVGVVHGRLISSSLQVAWQFHMCLLSKTANSNGPTTSLKFYSSAEVC